MLRVFEQSISKENVNRIHYCFYMWFDCTMKASFQVIKLLLEFRKAPRRMTRPCSSLESFLYFLNMQSGIELKVGLSSLSS